MLRNSKVIFFFVYGVTFCSVFGCQKVICFFEKPIFWLSKSEKTICPGELLRILGSVFSAKHHPVLCFITPPINIKQRSTPYDILA